MPIYAYRCDACGHELDALQKLSDAPLTDCPACGEAALKKQLTAAAFRLKGAGWYETDFKKDGKKNLHDGGGDAGKAASSDKGADKGTGSTADKGNDKAGDAKPAPAASPAKTAAAPASTASKPAATAG